MVIIDYTYSYNYKRDLVKSDGFDMFRLSDRDIIEKLTGHGVYGL